MSRIIPKDRHDPKAFSLRFRMLMAFHNLTLQKIAEHTDNAISTVGTWKNGRLPANMSTIEKLGQLFQVTTDYLLTGATTGQANSASLAKIQEVEAEIAQISGVSQSQQQGGWNQQSLRPQIEAHVQRFLTQNQNSSGTLQDTWAAVQAAMPLSQPNN